MPWPIPLRVGGGQQMQGPLILAPEAAFADLDLTPDISGGNDFLTANTGAALISTFDGGVIGQIIRIRVNDVNTSFANGATLATLSGQNELAVNGEVYTFKLVGTVWECINRSSVLMTVYFGGNLQAGETVLRYPIVYEITAAATVADGQSASRFGMPAGAVINRATLKVNEFGTDTFDLFRLLSEDVEIFTSGGGLGLINEANVQFFPNVAVVADDDVEVEFNKAGTNAAMFCSGLVEFRVAG